MRIKFSNFLYLSFFILIIVFTFIIANKIGAFFLGAASLYVLFAYTRNKKEKIREEDKRTRLYAKEKIKEQEKAEIAENAEKILENYKI